MQLSRLSPLAALQKARAQLTQVRSIFKNSIGSAACCLPRSSSLSLAAHVGNEGSPGPGRYSTVVSHQQNYPDPGSYYDTELPSHIGEASSVPL